MSDQGGDEAPQAAGGGGHLDWKGVYEKRLVKVFETLNLLPPALAPLAKEFGEALAEWAAVPLLLRRLRRGMDKMASLSPSTPAPSAPDSEHAQKQRREVLLAAEEVSLISEKLMQMLKAIDPKHFQCGSVRRRKDVQLLIDSLYRMLKFLYLRWLSELSGYRDYCQHRALRQMEQEEVTGESGVGDEDDKLSEDDEEIASTGSHHDSEQWKELEEIEGNVSDLLTPVSPEAAAFWATNFKEPLKFMVSWEDFFHAITAHLGYSPSQAATDHLATVLDPARSEMVSVIRFRDFLKGFSPFSECLTKFADLVSKEWYHGYTSHYEAERLLEGEPPGTFLVRHINLLPGTLAIALTHSAGTPSTILHIMIHNHEEAAARQKKLNIPGKGELVLGGFSVEQDGQLWHFSSAPALVGHFQRILVRPYASSLNTEPWFYADLSSQETIRMLNNQPGGTFLLRFSSRLRTCLAIAYVGNDGQILHSLIEKVVDPAATQRVYRQRLEQVPENAYIPTFPTVNEFIEAYQSVLAFPFIDTLTVVHNIEEEAKRMLDEAEKKLMPKEKKDEERFLWRRSSALNTSSGSFSPGGGSGVMVGGRRMTDSRPRSDSGRDKRVFGSDLITSMEAQRLRESWLELDIPFFADQVIRYLYMHVREEGLFRVTDSSTDAKLFIEKINRGVEVDLFAMNKPHLMAMLLKAYLRELRRPLIVPELFSKFIIVNDATPLEYVKDLLGQLPKDHIALLKCLLKLLHRVASEETSKMNAHNLAVCIGPNILRHTDNVSLEASLEASHSVYAVCTILIEKAYTLFPELEEHSLEYIESEEIVLMPSRRQIKSATMETLFRTIYTCPKGLIPASYANYVNVFLLTYHSWATSAELLDSMTHLYLELSNQNDQNKVALMRICAFLKKWTREQFYEFQDDPQLLEAYEQFVSGSKDIQVVRTLAPTLAKMKAGKGEVKLMFSEATPKPRMPSKRPLRTVLQVSPIELARQLTLVEYDIFARIKPIELVEKAWMEPDKVKRAPNVMALVSHFNQAVQWFITQIVNEESARKRESVMDHIVKIAQCCRTLNNFNAVQEILAAFSSAPVSRLLQAKRTVQSPEFLELKELMGISNNFSKYRRAVRDANPPLVPYLGRFLTDLNFIEDANKIRISANNHVNFRKCYLVADVIQELQRYQQTPYNLAPVPVVRDFLLEVGRTLSDDEAYQRSRLVQPQKVTID